MKRLLVIDDDPDVGVALRAKLEAGQQYSVMTATSGQEALRLLQTNRPDLMLCDIDMPGMDGVSLAETIGMSSDMKSIPLIFLSALVTPGDMKRGVTAGSHPMLSKAASVQDLVERIEQTLAG